MLISNFIIITQNRKDNLTSTNKSVTKRYALIKKE